MPPPDPRLKVVCASNEGAAASIKSRVAVARASLDRPGETRLPAATTALPDTAAREDRAPSKGKRGRPGSGEPWKAEGISRATYFARRKAAKAVK